ncbi:MAG TPA: DsrE family protein [Myxococcaceae bacterium]|nr:DsrE family protein [Myxococcaceae bacterium]
MTCNASRAAVLPPRPLLTQLNGLPLLSRLFPLLLLAAALLLPGKAWSAEPTSPRAPAKGKLVFVTTTGLEDIGSLSSSLRHAKTAAESGLLSEVVWLSYGRSIVVLDPSLSAVPENVRKLAKEAQAAGVRMVACATAIQKFGMNPKMLEPQAEVVPNGIHELARLVNEGFQIIRY